MTKLAIKIYLYFKNHKALFYTILFASTILFAILGSQIRLDEDISKLLPSTEKGGAEDLVFSDLKVKDKIFLLFHPKTTEVEQEELIYAADDFVSSLLEQDEESKYIDNVLYQLDEDVFQQAISYLYEHAPLFLDSAQYSDLEALLDLESMDAQMKENYELLTSPAGSAYMDMIRQDPIALRKVFLSNLGDLGEGMGGNFIFLDNHFFAADSSLLLAFLSPNFKSFDSKQGTRLVDMLQREIAVFEAANPEIEVLFHGAPVQSVFNSKRIKKDLLLTISVSLILVFTLLIICFKNKSSLIYLVIPVIYGVLFSLAVMYLIKGSMSLMALGIGAIVMGVAFSYCLHVITHYKYVNSPVKVLKDQTRPLILGALTTIGSFMGLMLTKSELLQDFGLFASFGLLGTTVFCLIFLPQFFRSENNKKSEKAFAVIEKINAYPLDQKKYLVVSVVLISVLGFVFAGRVKFDSNLQHIGYHEDKVQRSQKLLAASSASEYPTVYFAAVSASLDSALIYAQKLTNKLDESKQEHKIQGYSSMFSIFSTQAEQQKRIDQWTSFWNDEQLSKLAQNLHQVGAKYRFSDQSFQPFISMLEADYEPASLYESGLIPQGLLDNIIEYTNDQYLVFIPVQMDKEELETVGREIVGYDPHYVVVDPMFYTSSMVKTIHDDFNLIFAISSLFVLAVLLISFRSVILALLAFLPMFLSWYIVLGVMAIFGISFNLINIVISSFIFGVGVDYSIYIMDGLMASYQTREPRLKYHKTAIFFSAIILIVVVVALLFAKHPAIASISLSTLIGMGSTILISYSLQPYLFNKLIVERAKKGKAPLSIIGLFAGKKAQTLNRRIKNNYLYKGNSVESALRQQLKETANFRLITKETQDEKSVLDFGCDYGYIDYWLSLVNEELKITAYDTSSEALELADNVYAKNRSICFTMDSSLLNNSYDVVILQKHILVDEHLVYQLLSQCKKVVVKKEWINKFKKYIEELGLVFKDEDAIYVAFVTKN